MTSPVTSAKPPQPPSKHARHLASALASLATGEVVGKLATLATFAWAARLLGVADFGLFTYALGIGLLLATIPSLGLNARLIQLTGRDPRLLNEYLGPLMAARIALTLVAFGAAVPFALARDSASARWTIMLMVGAAAIDVFTDAQRSACIVLERQSATAIVTVFQRTLTLVLAVGLLAYSPSAVSLAVAFALAGIAAFIAMTLIARKHGARTDFRQVTPARMKTVLRAAPVMGTNEIIGESVTRIDVILIQAFLGDAAVGVYGVAYRLMETVLFVTWSIGHALVPDMVKAKNKEDLGRTVGIGVALMFIIYLPYGAVLASLGQSMVDFLFGSQFDIGAILLFLAPAPLLFGLGQLARKTLFARYPAPIVPVATALALAVNIAVIVALANSLGVEAAAIAKTAAYGVQMVVLWLVLLKFARPNGAGRGIMVAAAATAAATVPMLASLPLIPALLLAGTIYCLVWVALTWIFDPVMMRRIRLLGERRTTP